MAEDSESQTKRDPARRAEIRAAIERSERRFQSVGPFESADLIRETRDSAR